MKYAKWDIGTFDPAFVDSLEHNGIPRLAASVLSSRGIATLESAREYLANDDSLIGDWRLLRDIEVAAERIVSAINASKRIIVYGDYDVDGITSVCVLLRQLRSMNADCGWYIPDRIDEGYGLNAAAIDKLAQSGAGLIVTVDCGITSVSEVRHASELGVEVIITDHHECKNELPDAAAIVNPHRPDCGYPFKALAGVGVVFKLVCALSNQPVAEVLARFSDLICIGTVADVMPIYGENRAIVAHGLSSLENTRNPGLLSLLRESGIADKTVSTTTIGYSLAPRINAAGRMGGPETAVELLLTDDTARAAELAGELCQKNKQRQKIETDIYLQVSGDIERELSDGAPLPPAIVRWGEGWHQGVIGVVASRLLSRYNRPVLLICLESGIGKGSARSLPGVNIFQGFELCSDCLITYGGHDMAAGFSLEEGKLTELRDRICEYASQFSDRFDQRRTLSVDCTVNPAELSESAVASITVLEPFGVGNPVPIFCLENMRITQLTHVGEGKHLKLRLEQGSAYVGGIFFGTTSAAFGIKEGDLVDVVCHLEINQFRNSRSIQAVICDIRLSAMQAARIQSEINIYRDFRRDGQLTPPGSGRIKPDRRDFAAIWRHLLSIVDVNRSVTIGALDLLRSYMRELEPECAYIRMMLCLDVLSEHNLLNYSETEDILAITLMPTSGKTDLSKSKILAKLQL